MYGRVKQRVRRRLGSSTSTAASRTGATAVPPPTLGVLQCVPEDDG